MAKKDEFKLTNLPIEAQDKSITKDDFKLVAESKDIKDKAFNTKPTTFFKDCVKRFAKNKSSVVAAGILGVLLLMSIVVPMFGEEGTVRDVSKPNTAIRYLEPKLFNDGPFWNGKKKMENVPIDSTTGLPSSIYVSTAISNYNVTGENYTQYASQYGRGGYVSFNAFSNNKTEKEYYISPAGSLESYDFEADLRIKNFVVFNENDLANSNEDIKTLEPGYECAESKLRLAFAGAEGAEYIDLTDYATSHNDAEIDVKAKYFEYKEAHGLSGSIVQEPRFQIVIKAVPEKNVCALIKSIKFESGSSNVNTKSVIESASFESGNDCFNRPATDLGVWINSFDSLYTNLTSYLIKATFASFDYDTYAAALGETVDYIDRTDYTLYRNKGWLTCNAHYAEYNEETGKYEMPAGMDFICRIDNPDKCPVVEQFSFDDVEFGSDGLILQIHCKILKHRYLYNLDKMPIFLMGTDTSGRDMFINVFQGLRTSLLLGLGTTVVCFIFGLIWGSISGYFGGTVDLIMERFTDILSGVPWIVVMTLVIIKAGTSSFLVFGIALCLTGWIGTAATTRTQFYRFRGREYVLASRTLGANHGRLIAKHILPNAMGTIITSAVLMVPSVIFEEATLSYLGLAKLGDKDSGLSSLGVILENNQKELTDHPFLLIFPSIIIALIMISFNLFGNGLRDAVNPSLKGEGE